MLRVVCDRCGKRYAVQGAPSPGRKYRVKCKACGNVIVLTGGEDGNASPAPSVAPAPRTEPVPLPASEHPQATPAAELGGPTRDPFAPEAPTAPAPTPTPTPTPAPTAPDPFAGLATRGAPPSPLPAPRAPDGEPSPPPARPPSARYVELFDPGDLEDAPLDVAPAAERRRAPEPYAAPARDAESAPPERSGFGKLVLVTAAAWIVVMVGIFGVWTLRRGSRPKPDAPAASEASAPATAAPPPPAPTPPPESAAPSQTASPAAAPSPAPPAPEPQVAPAEPAAAPEPAPPPQTARPEKRPPKATPSKKPEKPHPPERTASIAPTPPARAPAPAAPPPAAAPAPSAPASEPNAAPAASASAPDRTLPNGLGDGEIQRALAGGRKAFQACLREHARTVDVPPGGRQISIRFSVAPSGAVSYPTIDDVTVSSTPLGQCLKTAARGLLFPPFQGDPIKVDAPLAIPER